MTERRVQVTIDETSTGKWLLTATLSAPYLRGRLRVWRAERTVTKTLPNRYASELTADLLTEWVTALSLVAAGWYETPPLPFE